MIYNPNKYINGIIDSKFLLFLLRVIENFKTIKYTQHSTSKIKSYYSLDRQYGEGIYNDFFKVAFNFQLINKLNFYIRDMGGEAYKKNNNNAIILHHIEFNSNTSIYKDILDKYDKRYFNISLEFEPNYKFINIFLKKYIKLWRGDHLELLHANYLLAENHLNEYYNYKDNLIKKYGFSFKIELSEIKKLNFDLIPCLIYEHFNGKINIDSTHFYLDYINISILKKKYEFKEDNIIYLKNNIEYNIKTHIFKNTTNNKEYEITKQYFKFMDILIKNKGRRVSFIDIQNYIGENNISDGTYKGNFKKSLKREGILLDKQEIIVGKNKGYKLEIEIN